MPLSVRRRRSLVGTAQDSLACCGACASRPLASSGPLKATPVSRRRSGNGHDLSSGTVPTPEQAHQRPTHVGHLNPTLDRADALDLGDAVRRRTVPLVPRGRPGRGSRRRGAHRDAPRHAPLATLPPNPVGRRSLARRSRSSLQGRPALGAGSSRHRGSSAGVRRPAWLARLRASHPPGRRRSPQAHGRPGAARTFLSRSPRPTRGRRRVLRQWPHTHRDRSGQGRASRRSSPTADARTCRQSCATGPGAGPSPARSATWVATPNQAERRVDMLQFPERELPD